MRLREKMKVISCIFLAAALQLSAQPTSGARLAGIINLPDFKCAVLEVSKQQPQVVLKEGEHWWGSDNIEVLEIHPENATVKFKMTPGSAATTLTLGRTDQLNHPAITLEGASMNAVIFLLQEFVNRSVLRPAYLQGGSFDLRAAATNRADGAKVLENALTEQKVTVIPDGEKFLMVVPKAMARTVKPHSPPLPPIPTTTTNAGLEIIPAGTIDFRGADTFTVLAVYARLLGKEFDPDLRQIPTSQIYFRSQTLLTKEEVIYALDTLLAWNRAKVVPASEGFVKAVSLAE